MGGNNSKQLESQKKGLEDENARLKAELADEKRRFLRVHAYLTPRWLRPAGDPTVVRAPPDQMQLYRQIAEAQVKAIHDGAAQRAQLRSDAKAAAASDDMAVIGDLVGASQVEVTYIDKAPLGDDLAIAAILVIRQSYVLKSVTISGCGLTDAGCGALAAIMHQAPPTFALLDLSRNPEITARGAALLLGAMADPLIAQRPSGPFELDLRSCDKFWDGEKCLLDALQTAVERVPGSIKGLPPPHIKVPERPIPPFDVDGTPVYLNQFKQNPESRDYDPLTLANGITLHREDIELRGDKAKIKATMLADLLTVIHQAQCKSKVQRAGLGCGSHHLAHIFFVYQQLGKVIVVVESFDPHDTYTALLSKYKISDRAKYEIFIQLIQAVLFLHSQNSALRELRADQFIVKRQIGAFTHCRYVDYSHLRSEASSTRQPSLGALKFSDPAMVKGTTVTRKWDHYSVAMMILLAYKFCATTETFSDGLYNWASPHIMPIDEQITVALEHYQETYKLPEPVAKIIVGLTRSDLDNRMKLEDALSQFRELLKDEPPEQ